MFDLGRMLRGAVQWEAEPSGGGAGDPVVVEDAPELEADELEEPAPTAEVEEESEPEQEPLHPPERVQALLNQLYGRAPVPPSAPRAVPPQVPPPAAGPQRPPASLMDVNPEAWQEQFLTYAKAEAKRELLAELAPQVQQVAQRQQQETQGRVLSALQRMSHEVQRNAYGPNGTFSRSQPYRENPAVKELCDQLLEERLVRAAQMGVNQGDTEAATALAHPDYPEQILALALSMVGALPKESLYGPKPIRVKGASLQSPTTAKSSKETKAYDRAVREAREFGSDLTAKQLREAEEIVKRGIG